MSSESSGHGNYSNSFKKSWRRIQTFNISSLPALCARLAGFTAAKPVTHPLYSQPTSCRIAQSFCGTESTWVGPRAQIPWIRHFLRGFSGQMHPLREEKRTSREPLKQSEISWTSSYRSISPPTISKVSCPMTRILGIQSGQWDADAQRS